MNHPTARQKSMSPLKSLAKKAAVPFFISLVLVTSLVVLRFRISNSQQINNAKAVTGTRTNLIIMFNFKNFPHKPFSQTDVQNMITNGQDFIKKNSFGQFQVNSTIANFLPASTQKDWWTIDMDNKGCPDIMSVDSDQRWQKAALAKAQENGVNTSGYYYYTFLFAHSDDCQKSDGKAIKGYEVHNKIWLNDTADSKIFAHELFHSLFIGHTYHDIDDVMSDDRDADSKEHLNSYFKLLQNWINVKFLSNSEDVIINNIDGTGQTNGYYSIGVPFKDGFYLFLTHRQIHGVSTISVHKTKIDYWPEGDFYSAELIKKISLNEEYTTETGWKIQFLLDRRGYFARVTKPAFTTLTDCETPALVSNNSLLGKLDNAQESGLLQGWAVDTDTKTSSIKVHMYLNKPAGAGGIFLGEDATDMLRSDVNQSLGITGNHGFEFTIPSTYRNNANHCVYVYAIDTNGGYNKLINGSPQKVFLTSDSGGSSSSTTVEIGGNIWDTNGLGVPNVKVTLEGIGAAGYLKAYYPVTAVNGHWKQGGFITSGGTYNVKVDGIVKTIMDKNSKDHGTGLDTPFGSISYLNQKAGKLDCTEDKGWVFKRCNFVIKKPLDTPSSVSGVSLLLYRPSTYDQGKYKLNKTFISADGKTMYTRKCEFNQYVGYTTKCDGYTSYSQQAPTASLGYDAILYKDSQGKSWVRQTFIATDGITQHTRNCLFDVNTGATSTCTAFSSSPIGAPAAVREVTHFLAFGKLTETYISKDGKTSYSRYCSFNATTMISGCDAFKTATANNWYGYGAFVFTDLYGAQRLQQFLVGSDGRTPFFRNCTINSATSVSCPKFL